MCYPVDSVILENVCVLKKIMFKASRFFLDGMCIASHGATRTDDDGWKMI